MKHFFAKLTYKSQHIAVQPVMAQPLPRFTKTSWHIACCVDTNMTRHKAT